MDGKTKAQRRGWFAQAHTARTSAQVLKPGQPTLALYHGWVGSRLDTGFTDGGLLEKCNPILTGG